MNEIYNIYCDESCHLEHDRIPVMVLGCVWTPYGKTREISQELRKIKSKHNISSHFELKWIKVSNAKIAFYLDVIEYFFDDDDLHFRGVLIPDKNLLDHRAFEQTHDSWYYKMLFVMLEPIINPQRKYRVYLDIKDTQSETKRKLLEEVLRNSRHDNVGRIIEKVQQIRSHESEIIQLTDFLLGAIAYNSRSQTGDLKNAHQNLAKVQIIRRIQRRSGKSLVDTTWLCEPKFNLLVWRPGNKGGLIQ